MSFRFLFCHPEERRISILFPFSLEFLELVYVMVVIMSLITQTKKNNYAFIDSQNLNLAIRDQGWVLDYARFRIYLRDKYDIKKAFLFFGYIPENEELYNYLRRSGYTIIFKPVVIHVIEGNQQIKGNVDAELVLQSMVELNNYDQATIISGDGDFYCLIDYLIDVGKLKCLIIPNRLKYSALLRKFGRYTDFLNDLKYKLSK